jgi:DNA recombination protein RmuC
MADPVVLIGVGTAAAALGALAAGIGWQRDLARKNAQIAEMGMDLSALRARLAETQSRVEALLAELSHLRQTGQDLSARNAELAALYQQEKSRTAENAALLENARHQMADAYRALSADALAANNRIFMDMARQVLTTCVESARRDLNVKGEAIAAMVAPLREALDRYQTQALEMERVRQQAYGGLTEQVGALLKSQRELEKENQKLILALKAPQVRGRWGEITLRRVAELTGMQAHCDFDEQVSTAGPGGPLRPDMIVRLPANRLIVVDAKVSLSAFLDSLQAGTEAERAACLAAHARQIQAHVLRLSQKAYWQQFQPTPDFVVLFIPGENFFAAALSQLPGLMEFAMEKGVILATPTTLMALLKAVAFSWRQAQMAENAGAVLQLGRLLFSRLTTFFQHLEPLGRDISRCVDGFNTLVGSLETRVMPTARKFESLGLAPVGTLRPAAPLDKTVRRPVAGAGSNGGNRGEEQ